MQRKSKLKPKRLKFILEYLIDFDGTSAAIRAGYSEHSARFIAHQLMLNPEVKAEYEKRYAEYKKKYEIRREGIVADLYELKNKCKNDDDRAHLVKTLDILNKMAGQYTVNTNINLNSEQPLFPD